VVDGATGLPNWFRVDGALRKVRAADLAFGNLDHTCYDPVYDLAGVDPGSPNGAFVAALRAAYPCDPERFLLYELVHLQEGFTGWSRDRRASARAVQRYLAGAFPASVPRSGPLCALDIDGVLESLALGFPTITPTALLAMRALARHGFRPVPVTGRSLEEVRDRCATLSLPGGVAEYGAVAYDHVGNGTVQVVSEADRALLDRLREVLRTTPGARVDEDYRYSVRGYASGAGWRPVPAEALESALGALGADRHRLRVVRGYYQTDVVAAAVDKGVGLDALARLLGDDNPVPVRLAVGDTASDLPMLARAEDAFAPANAAPEVREAGVTVLRTAYAAGVAAAAASVLRHRPGGCARCRPVPPGPDSRLLLTVLDAPRAGRAGLPAAVVRLAAVLAADRR
jgi:hydroxymethylpyrimidine pyrophosphatase-like HAD family hydrolase